MHIRVGDLLPGDLIDANGVWLVLSVKRSGQTETSEISWLGPRGRYYAPAWSEDVVLLSHIE